MRHWDIITGEYPPQSGGVGDYTRGVALGLVIAGDQVRVWAPPCKGRDVVERGIEVCRLPDHFHWRSLMALTAGLADRPDDSPALLQYVPHAFGWKAMNLLFCIWLFAKRPKTLWVIYHEVAVQIAWKSPLKSNFIGAITHLMSVLVARAAKKIWVTIPAWKALLTPVVNIGTPIDCLPVPSNIPVFEDPDSIQVIRGNLLTAMPHLVGHFGTYRSENARLLMRVIPALMSVCSTHLVLIGQNSVDFLQQLLAQYPDLKARTTASGALSHEDLSAHLQACDLMVQPYPDGVSGRRTSMMACLAHGLPVITSQGSATEEYWAGCGAVNLISGSQDSGFALASRTLLADSAVRQTLGVRAKRLYDERFALARTITVLRDAAFAEECHFSIPVQCQ